MKPEKRLRVEHPVPHSRAQGGLANWSQEQPDQGKGVLKLRPMVFGVSKEEPSEKAVYLPVSH